MSHMTRDEVGVLMTALDVFHPENGGDYEGVIRAVEAILTDRKLMSDTAENEEPLRDSRGRDTRIHGIVLDEGNPGPTLRELLRQWIASGVKPPGDLRGRTLAVLEVIGPDGTAGTRVLPPGNGDANA